MESLVPTLTLQQLKQNAKLINRYLKTLGVDLAHSTALDIASNGIGYENYNIAKAALEKAVLRDDVLIDAIKSRPYEEFKKNGDPVMLQTSSMNDYRTSTEMALPDEPIPMKRQYNFVKPMRRGVTGYIKNLRDKAHSWEEMKYKNTDIQYIENQSTAIFGAARTGKTYLMLLWADHIMKEAKNQTFVYFLTQWHIEGLGVGRARIRDASESVNGVLRMIEPAQFSADGGADVLIVYDDSKMEEMLEVIRKAMAKGYHIFIDENKYIFEMLDEVTSKGYKNYTIALQGIGDLFHKSNRAFSEYGFDNVLIGRENDMNSEKYYQSGGIDIGLEQYMNLRAREFYIASF